MSNRSTRERRTASHHRARFASLAAVLVAAAACGGSTTTPDVNALHGEVSDATGDAVADPSAPVSPDLVHGTIDVTGGNIAVTIRFAPGTFDRATSRVTVDLDTDQNPSTGIRTGNGLGVDWARDLWAAPIQAGVLQATPATCAADPCYRQVSTTPLNIIADGMTVTMPLSTFGSVDGRLSFRVFAYASRPAATSLATVTTDIMPDIAVAPGRVP
jgi:hypothetical protein